MMQYYFLICPFSNDKGISGTDESSGKPLETVGPRGISNYVEYRTIIYQNIIRIIRVTKII